MKNRWMLLSVVGVFVSLGWGCVDGARSLNAEEPVTGNKEARLAGSFHVDELQLAAVISGDSMSVSIPIQGTRPGLLLGTCGVSLTDLSGTVLSSSSSSFELDGAGVVTLDLAASSLNLQGADEVTGLIRYDVSVGSQRVVGYRSLFYVLEKLDLRARVPASLQEGTASHLRVFALDPLTHTPRAGIEVSVELEHADTEAKQSFTAITDASGTAVIKVPAQGVGKYTARTSAGTGTMTFASLETQLTVERESKVLVTTDKPLYKPGQTMHIRALALKKPRQEAQAGAETTLEVFDGKGNMVFRKFGETNDFGIVAATFKIADQVNIGAYKIAITVGKTTTEKTVQVKPYQLPKFKLETELSAAFYLVGDVVEGSISARYFFGKPVNGAVEVKAFAMGVAVEEIGFASGTTDSDGNFSFSVDLPAYLVGQPMEGGNGVVSFEVSVEDSAGNVVTKTRSVVVAQDPIEWIAIPESGSLVKGLPNGIFIFATDPLGHPVAADFVVKEDDQALTLEALGEGIIKVTVTPTENTTLYVQVQAGGDTVESSVHLLVDASQEGLLVRTDKALYTVGESVAVQAFVGGSGGKVFFDVIKDGQTALTTSSELKAGVASFVLDLDGSLSGDVLVEAYRVQDTGQIIRDKRLIFVRDANNLHIAVDTDKAQYKPGEEAVITFEVTDRSGSPKVAALGVQIVDEAVYALSENKPGLLETYFLIQEALQKPHYQIEGAHFDLGSIVTQAPDEPQVQTVAAAAFSALDLQGGLGERSSWAGVTAAIPSVLAPHFQSHQQKISAFFEHLQEAGALKSESVQARVEGQSVFYDYWGNLYVFKVHEKWDGWRAKFTSMGPDEIAGTEDDWSGTVMVLHPEWEDDPFMTGGAQDAASPATENDFEEQSPPQEGGTTSGSEGPKVRKNFPETLYYHPSLITDERGRAEVTLTMADSITQWRISTLANSTDGALGSSTDSVTVFQDFFIDVSFPAVVSRLDEITFPVALYNYLTEAQTVEVTLESSSWFTALGGLTQSVTLAPGEVTSISFPVKITEVGTHALTVIGTGSTLSDAVQRTVEVRPNGTAVLSSASGLLEGSALHDVSFPADMVPDSQGLLVKIYPGIMAQAVEGLDSMLREPHGCFEQTTSSNWPNTLVLDYLNTTGQSSPEVELKAMSYLNQGYQRLLTFECTGGGFVWFGDPAPANVILSAMGVLEFADMSRVMEIDQDVIKRTADWVIADQKSDGSWHTNQGSEFATVQYDDAKTTAFVTWALAESPYGASAVAKAVSYLEPLAVAPATDIYTLAMTANAFAAHDPNASRTTALLNRLAGLATVGSDGAVSWVYQQNPTTIEVTALTVQAMVAAGVHSDLVGGALGFLAGQKDGLGNWNTTHATILTLRAMIRAAAHKTEEGEGTVTVSLNGATLHTLQVTEENRNVFHQFELSDTLNAEEVNSLEVSYEGTGKLMYQAVWTHYEALPEVAVPGEALTIAVAYDQTSLQVNDVVTATVTVKNLSDAQLDMPMLDLGVPPGFKVLGGKLKAAVEAQEILKYELPGQQISIYLQKLMPGQTFQLSWDLQALFPVKAQTPPSSVYLYYEKTQRADIAGTMIEVVE